MAAGTVKCTDLFCSIMKCIKDNDLRFSGYDLPPPMPGEVLLQGGTCALKGSEGFSIVTQNQWDGMEETGLAILLHSIPIQV